MKKCTLLFFALVLCGFTIKAQQFNSLPGSLQHARSMKMNMIHADNDMGFIQRGPSETVYLMDSSLAFKWNAVSSTWNNTALSKNEYTYDNNGRLLSSNSFRWRGASNEWIDNTEYHIVYNPNGDISEWISSRYDTISSLWVPEEHDSMFYDNSHQIIRETWNLYNNADQSWHVFFLLAWEYDASGGITEQYTKYWDETTGELMGGSRSTYILNSMDMPTETIEQSLDAATDTWIDENQVISEYTNNTILDKETINMWSGTAWTLISQNIYSYSGDLLQEELTQMWDEGTLTWMDIKKTSYIHDAGHIISELTQNWFIDHWADYSLLTFVYNTNSQLTDYTFLMYNTMTGLVTYGYNYIYNFDINNLNDYTISRVWSLTLSDWLNTTKTNKYYSLHTSLGENELSAGNFSVYPNPATSVLQISGILPSCGIVVCDIRGKILISKTAGSDSGIIDIEGLSKGMYLLKIYDRKLVRAVKFVKQ